MRILISNDDGYQAPGIVALHEALCKVADVEVVAPEQNNSAKSNALTLHSPLYVQRAANGFRFINGTPADCVHVALTGLPAQSGLFLFACGTSALLVYAHRGNITRMIAGTESRFNACPWFCSDCS